MCGRGRARGWEGVRAAERVRVCARALVFVRVGGWRATCAPHLLMDPILEGSRSRSLYVGGCACDVRACVSLRVRVFGGLRRTDGDVSARARAKMMQTTRVRVRNDARTCVWIMW